VNQLFSEENMDNIGKIIANVEVATNKASEIEEKAMTSLEEVDSTLKHFRASMERLTKDFGAMKGVVNPTVEKLLSTTDDFRRVTLKVEKSIDRGDYNIKKILDPVLIDIQILSSQINDLAQQLEESPSDLLFRSRTPRKGPGE
jgi:phospholipid/cholesterol/gamma-HCH transport system substrate-binding protein